MSQPPRVFISYSRKDEAWKDRLVTHLKVLARGGVLETWDDQRIVVGDDWQGEIEVALDQAAAAVLLVSTDFLASDFIQGEEVPRLLRLREETGLRVIPLIVEPCAWREIDWLKRIQARPRDGQPLSGLSKHHAEDALAKLAIEVAGLLATPRQAERTNEHASDRRSWSKRERITLLFLAANPVDGKPIALDEEARDIQAKIRAADFRDAIDFQTRWAARPDDLLQALNETRPTIVHFSGHGGEGEIYFKGDDGQARPVTREALQAAFGPFRHDVRLVVLNACFSDEQAEALTSVVECAAGMSAAINDTAARAFAASFYRGIGFGHSVRNAFDQGVAAVMLAGVEREAGKPKLVTRAGVDADALYLLAPDRR